MTHLPGMRRCRRLKGAVHMLSLLTNEDKNSSGDEIASVLVNDDIAHT